MAMTKQAHSEAIQKIAALDERDSANAVEIGFMKAAQDMGLTEEQYLAFRKLAVEAVQAEPKQ